MTNPTIKQVQSDPCASYWVKHAIEQLLRRDPVDAAHDAELLAKLFGERCDAILKGALGSKDRANAY